MIYNARSSENFEGRYVPDVIWGMVIQVAFPQGSSPRWVPSLGIGARSSFHENLFTEHLHAWSSLCKLRTDSEYSMWDMTSELSIHITWLQCRYLRCRAILAILALIFTCNIILLIYAEINTSILPENPTGRLGNVTLLHPDNHVTKFMAKFRQDHPEEHKLLDLVNKNYMVETSTCRMEEARRGIRIESPYMLGVGREFALCYRGGARKNIETQYPWWRAEVVYSSKEFEFKLIYWF